MHYLGRESCFAVVKHSQLGYRVVIIAEADCSATNVGEEPKPAIDHYLEWKMEAYLQGCLDQIVQRVDFDLARFVDQLGTPCYELVKSC